MKKNKVFPVNSIPDKYRDGIIIVKASLVDLSESEEAAHSHRDEGHLFILQEKGTTEIEIDFQKHCLEESSLIYVHPNQVHRLISFENSTLISWIITSENLQPENLKLLEDLTPAKALSINSETLSIISEAASLCIKLSERKDEKLYNFVKKESCNTLVALVISQYLAQSKSTENLSRSTVITKAFKKALENDFILVKSPTEYAKKINISTPYLNECVKTTTGHSVSYHIQQRVILEAQRMLYHSDKSVKEIAGELGYDDYSYFTRLFTKVTGLTPLAFRNKNLD